MLKTAQLSAYAENHVSLECCRESVTTITHGDYHFLLRVSNFGDLAAFRGFLATFSLRMHRNASMSFRLKFWHRHSIPWLRFPCRKRYFGDSKTFSVAFCIAHAERPPSFYFRSSWPTDLKSVTCFSPQAENFHQIWSLYSSPLPS